MRRLSINQCSSYRWPFFQDVIQYAKHGFSSIGLWRSKVEDFGFEDAADLLAEMQMNVTSFSWAGGFTGSGGVSHTMAIEDSIEAVYQAHMVNAGNLVIHPGGRNGHTDSHALRLFKSALQEILPIAKDLEVQVLLEPVVAKQNPWNFIATCEGYQALLADFCPTELGLVLDLCHVGRSQQFIQDIPQIADRVELVQLSDGRYSDGNFVRCSLGTGIIPIEGWLNLLADMDYAGAFEIELHGYEFENADYHGVLHSSQQYFLNTAKKILSGAATN